MGTRARDLSPGSTASRNPSLPNGSCRVLLVVDRPTPGEEMALLAQGLREMGGSTPIVVVPHRDPTSLAPGALRRVPGKMDPARDVVRAFLLRCRAHRMLRRARPDVVVISDDRQFGLELAVAALASRRCIPVVLVQCAWTTPTSDIFARRGNRRHRTRLMKRTVAQRFPDQVCDVSGERVLFYPLAATLFLRVLGMLPRRPWVLGGSGAVSVIAAMDDEQRDALTGPEGPKVITTGPPSFDRLKQAADRAKDSREGLLSELAFEDDRLLIVCALPQFGEHGLLSAPAHRRFITELCVALARLEANVIVSLHPTASKISKDLVIANGLRIAPRPLSSFLPAADVLVSGPSSVVRWARLLQIPTVIVDPLGLGLAENFTGYAVTIPGAEELAGEVRAAAERIQVRHPGRSPHSLDGHARSRILALIHRVAAASAPAGRG
jgi:hypothetical protein